MEINELIFTENLSKKKKNTWVESEDDGNEIQIHDHLYQKYLFFKKRKE